MIRYFIKEQSELKELEGQRGADWIHISPPFSNAELKEKAELFDIPLDFLTDSLDIDERSRYEREDDVKLIVVNTPILNDIDREIESIYITAPIGIILVPDHIITITAYDNPVLQMFLDNRVKNFNPGDAKLFVLQLLEQNVYRFLRCLKKLNVKRNLIEKELHDSSKNRELRQLLSIEKSLVYFVNSLSSNELLKMKMKRTDFLRISDDEDKADLFEDIIIDNSQALDMANIHTNILNGTMEAYAAIISNNMNMVISRLTLVTIILMVPTLIASYYGMNVPLPFEQNKYAIYYIFGMSIVLSLLLAWFFRRKKLF